MITSGKTVGRDLDQVEGCKPNLNIQPPPIRPRLATHSLDLPAMCDICNKARSVRNHANCSKVRQKRKSAEWESYMANVTAKRAQGGRA